MFTNCLAVREGVSWLPLLPLSEACSDLVAREAGVGRFVYLGTALGLFSGQDLRGIDETYPYPVHTPFPYCASKAEAERLVLAANAPGFETMSVRGGGFAWGPGAPMLRSLKEAVAGGQFMWVNQGRAHLTTTHVVNVAHAVALALRNGRGGQAYFANDGSATTVREFLTSLFETQGLKAPKRSVPRGMAWIVATLMETVWSATRRDADPPLPRLVVAMASSDITIRIDKVRRELGYEPVMTRERGLVELASH